jgi:hypothetical protein
MQSPEELDWFGGDTPIDSNFLNLGIDTGTKTDVVRLSNASSISMPFVMGKQKKKLRRSDGLRLALQHSSYRTRAGPDDRHTRTWFLLFTFTNYCRSPYTELLQIFFFLVVACDFWYTYYLPPLLN